MTFSPKMILAAAFFGFSLGVAMAEDAPAPTPAAPAAPAAIKVEAPWTRATVRGASVGVAYFTIVNTGSETDRLVSAASDSAGKAEIHESKITNGVMSMEALPKGIEIKPGSRITFKPGSYHLMLLGLKAALLPGETIHAVLTFAKAGQISIDLPVQNMGATTPPNAKEAGEKAEKSEDHMHHMDH